jgi:DNA replication and repair protein RecF
VERLRKTSVAGPHRDDLILTLDGRSLATYGSQGQQRTAVLALKLAEYATMRDRGGEAPLLLLDDVLSELDDDRAAAFVSGLGGYEQVFMTAVALPPRLRTEARVYGIERARVTPAC